LLHLVLTTQDFLTSLGGKLRGKVYWSTIICLHVNIIRIGSIPISTTK